MGTHDWPPWAPTPPHSSLRPHRRCILTDAELPRYPEQLDGEPDLAEILAAYDKAYAAGTQVAGWTTLASAYFWVVSGVPGWRLTAWGDRTRFLARARAGLLSDIARPWSRTWGLVGLTYDWIYHELAAAERQQVLAALGAVALARKADPSLNNMEELADRAAVLLCGVATAGDHAAGDQLYARLGTWWRGGGAGDFLDFFSEPDKGGFAEGVSYSTHTRGQINLVLFEESLRTATGQSRAAYYHPGHWLRSMAHWYATLLIPQPEPKGVVHRCWRAQAPRTLSEADSLGVTRYHCVTGDPDHLALLRYLQARRQGPLANAWLGSDRNAVVAKLLYGVNERRLMPKAPVELGRPLRVHHQNLGMVYARTGWTERDSLVVCQVGKWQLGGYCPKQMGNVAAYRNGPALLNPSPEVHYSWADGTIGGNCLYFPDASTPGVQRTLGNVGNLRELVPGGPRDLVDALEIDLSRLDAVTWTLDYQRAYVPGTVRALRRSFAWLVPQVPGADPDLFVVYDRIELADPARAARACWHVGAMDAPMVLGGLPTTVQRGDHQHAAFDLAQLVVSTVDTPVARNVVALTPLSPVRVVLVGGPNAAGQWSRADGHEYEDAYGAQKAADAVSPQNRPYNGWGRIEEVARAADGRIEMLRVIEVTDVGKPLTPVSRTAEGVVVGGRLVRLADGRLVA